MSLPCTSLSEVRSEWRGSRHQSLLALPILLNTSFRLGTCPRVTSSFWLHAFPLTRKEGQGTLWETRKRHQEENFLGQVASDLGPKGCLVA